MIRAFFAANRRLSRWIERRLPHGRDDLFTRYEQVVAGLMNRREGQLIADVGGGKSCPFSPYRQPGSGTRIVAVDVSEAEISQNRDVDEARVADIMRELPFADEEVDLLVSRSVLEHLDDVEAFIANSRRVLGPGGYFVHLVPCRNALFAVINRALPHRLSKRLLYFFQPQVAGICGFPAFYDRCTDSGLRELLDRYGFDVEKAEVSFYQSRYFDFFGPAYLLSAIYELIVRAANLRDLAAYVLVVARKRPGPEHATG